jgi:hypothetical protein
MTSTFAGALSTRLLLFPLLLVLHCSLSFVPFVSFVVNLESNLQ